MEERKISASPDYAAGKTYSLFGNGCSSEEYYRKIGLLADRVLDHSPNIFRLIALLDQASRKKRLLKKLLRPWRSVDSLLHFVVTSARDILAPHTSPVNAHLQTLPIFRRWDATLRTSEEQYHVYMLLIELANRAWGKAFRAADRRIAFLPYCLRDLNADCRSAPGELDMVCKGCSRDCYVNRVSALLRKMQIEPYIWMNAGLKPLLKKLRKNSRIGVLGLACVPELLHGMRLCMRLDIPVVGLPLNANRCMRWMGKFHPTSVDLQALRKLIGENLEEETS